MKLTAAVLTACLGVVLVVPAYSQVRDAGSGEAFQVRKNVLLTDARGFKLTEEVIENVTLLEDGVAQEVTDLRADLSPLYLQIVIDDSGSMSTVSAVSTAVAKFVVRSVDEGTYVQFVRFGNGIGVTSPWISDKAVLERYIDKAAGVGGCSPVYDSLMVALGQVKLAKEQPGDKKFAVLLISDTIENSSKVRLPDLLNELTKAEVPVFTVMLSDAIVRYNGRPGAEQMLQQMERFAHEAAFVSGGSAYFPLGYKNVGRPIQESLKPLVEELRAQFVVTYTPLNTKRDGKERALQMLLAESYDVKNTAAIKQSYVVPPMR